MILMKLDLLNLQVDIPLLDDLYLRSICARQIWHNQITLMSSFVQNLRKLTVSYCNNLEYLFTSSTVESFEQLEALRISRCKEMQVVILIEELVEKEKTSQTMFPKLDNLELYDLPQLIRFCSNCNSFGEVYEAQGLSGSGSQVVAAAQSKLVETEVTRLVFPRVTYLELRCLPNFKGFFPKIHITKWPLLKRMLVEQCDKVKTFASEFPSIEITNGGNQLERQTQDPMFWIGKDSFPRLEQLEFQQINNMEEIWRVQYPSKVQECSRLKNLVPSTVYFDNLQTLVVSECHGLVNLVRYSTAKSLGQLRRMKVADCEMIEEIVVCLGDAVNDGIVFTELECLQLKGLPRLASFCSGDCNFKFPALVTVIVTECPNMQIFSKGELSTPRLYKVKLAGDIYEYMDEDIEKKIDDIFNKDEDEDEAVEEDEVEDERSWEGNLNSTIQQLFTEKSARNCKDGNGENSDHDAKENDGN
ncbi:hypothetical protein SLA2020_019000 [Shorea laevis]